jgi:hypothetical protein
MNSVQVQFEKGTEQSKFLRYVDIGFTLAFFIELLINMSANLFWRFFSNPWSIFDLV